MHQPDNAIWRLCDPQGLTFRVWADEDIAVVYAGQQRTTHLLDALATEILRCLQATGPSRAIDLMHSLDPESPDVDSELADAVAASLNSLESVDLVTCSPC